MVDDAEQGITDIVRGADLIDSTPRQIDVVSRSMGFRYLLSRSSPTIHSARPLRLH